MAPQFKEGDGIFYGHDWDRKGKVDFVHDLGKGEYLYAITLDQKLETVTINTIKSGLQKKAEWKSLSPKEQKDNVEGKYLKAV
ncbi:hypothetical protein INS49_006220 [Diaporthe citri]|uniref:uncharacterized protein n=1 Tax=Diaporthe citri TaxID=83186 RepID=UPI001C824F6F|nr:uncharacterized protein INS49_006220 [Diaporthe citri]KAG6364617.1 hypothetical protein INS49_006220 [Diaporthe citri]